MHCTQNQTRGYTPTLVTLPETTEGSDADLSKKKFHAHTVVCALFWYLRRQHLIEKFTLEVDRIELCWQIVQCVLPVREHYTMSAFLFQFGLISSVVPLDLELIAKAVSKLKCKCEVLLMTTQTTNNQM